MLTKCANPDCSAQFRYLHEGKLFSIELHDRNANPPLPDSYFWESPRHTQYFWLCTECASKMTLKVEPGKGVVATPIAAPPLVMRQAA
jgi:hypothetical protein